MIKKAFKFVGYSTLAILMIAFCGFFVASFVGVEVRIDENKEMSFKVGDNGGISIIHELDREWISLPDSSYKKE